MPECTMTCVICDKKFVAGNKSALYCPQCKIIQNKKRANLYKKRLMQEKNQKKETKKPNISLSEMAALARAANMTYGEYVSMMERGVNNADHHN